MDQLDMEKILILEYQTIILITIKIFRVISMVAHLANMEELHLIPIVLLIIKIILIHTLLLHQTINIESSELI